MTTKLSDAEIAGLMEAVTRGTLAQWAERFVPLGGREDVLRAINAVPLLVAEVRSHRAADALAPWYEADGSTVMLPAEEVTRRRKLAAKAIAAWRKALAAAEQKHALGAWEIPDAEFQTLAAAVDAIDAAAGASATSPAPATAPDTAALARARSEGRREGIEEALRALVSDPTRAATASSIYEKGWDHGFDSAVGRVRALSGREDDK